MWTVRLNLVKTYEYLFEKTHSCKKSTALQFEFFEISSVWIGLKKILSESKHIIPRIH